MTDKEFTSWVARMFMSEAEALEKQANENISDEEIARLKSEYEAKHGDGWERLQKRIAEKSSNKTT